jgi:hypothetical protein
LGLLAEQRRATTAAAPKEKEKEGNEALAFALKARQRTLKKISKKSEVKILRFHPKLFLLLLTVEKWMDMLSPVR